MLQGIFNRAQKSLDTLVSKYVMRLAVAVPFVVAFGFGTAAASVRLSEEYGSGMAYAILCGAFAAIGLAAAGAIAISGQKTIALTESVPLEPESPKPSDAHASPILTPEVLLAAIGTVGPTAFPSLLKLLARNAPLVLAIVLVAYLLFVRSGQSPDASQEVAS